MVFYKWDNCRKCKEVGQVLLEFYSQEENFQIVFNYVLKVNIPKLLLYI